jgi:hypothetical protein
LRCPAEEDGEMTFVEAVRKHIAAKEGHVEDRPRTLLPKVVPF